MSKTAGSETLPAAHQTPHSVGEGRGASLGPPFDDSDPSQAVASGAEGVLWHVARHARSSRGGGAGSGRSSTSAGEGLLSDEELRAIESTYSEGIAAVQVVEIFASRGVRFSEATFRKYVQQGLLPRSRRIGRKGKHRGSMGVYPAKTVRRVNAIKRLMAEGYTIEDIQEQFLRYADAIEVVEEGLAEIFTRLETDVESPRFDNKTRRRIKREMGEARKTADELLSRIDGISRRVAAPRDERYRRGAAESAEDLL